MTDECLVTTGRDTTRTRMVNGAILAPQETQRLAIICTTGHHALRPVRSRGVVRLLAWTAKWRPQFWAENQSTFIPLGSQHRLRNPGKVLLELIEVQSGSYLGEDDIVRHDDVYGRA
jgi:hypothetical protein